MQNAECKMPNAKKSPVFCIVHFAFVHSGRHPFSGPWWHGCGNATASVLADLRYSARSLARTPGLTFALLLSVALGVGGNASVLGYIRGSATPDVPLSGIDAVVSLFARDDRGALGPISYARYSSIKSEHGVFELLGAARESQTSVIVGERSLVMSVAAVTPDIADLLQLSLRDGAVISDRVWRMEFESKAAVHGERIRIDGVDVPVAGVAPEWLEALYTGRVVDIWMLAPDATLQGLDPSSRTLWSLGRLRVGVSHRDAQAEIDSNENGGEAVAVLPYTGVAPEVAGGVTRIAALLPAAAAAVFLIACANVAAFLLSRGSARSHEMSIRVALGASRGRLRRQLLSDSLLVSAAGGAAGGLLAFWTARLIPALFFEQDARRLVFSPNISDIIATSAACAGVTVLCGLSPILQIRHDDPAAVLQREGSGPSSTLARVRAGLVLIQMTCCCLLVISTALLVEGFRDALRTQAGERLGNPVLATLQAPLRFRRSDLGLEYFRNAEQAVQSLAGISGSSWVATPPGNVPSRNGVRIEPPQLPVRDVVLDVVAFTPRSLPIVILPPVAGRLFSGGDTPESCRVAVINEEAAEELFDGDAVGRSIEDPANKRVEVIGIVRTRKSKTTLHSRPTIYYYADQTRTPLDRTGPARFRAPVLPKPASAVLGANIVSASYFDAVGMSLVAGRMFSSKHGAGGCRVGVINQEAAELYFGGNAVGGAIVDAAGRRTEIVGVVRSPMLRTVQRRGEATIYFPMGQDFLALMTLILTTRDANDALLTSVRERLAAIPGSSPDAAVVTTLDAHLSKTALAPERIATVLMAASASTAIALSILGLYAAMGDSARQRRREIAMRIALGAQGRHVTRQLLAQSLRLAAAATIAGLIGSLAVERWLGRVTSSAVSLTPSVWLAPPFVLLAAVAIASVVPVRRALGVDPIAIIREN